MATASRCSRPNAPFALPLVSLSPSVAVISDDTYDIVVNGRMKL